MNRNTRTALTLAALGIAILAVSAQAATYTWTGASDGDWTNAGNWDTNGVPVDTEPGGNLELDGLDRIVFDASGSANPLPTSNIPALGGNPFNNTAQSTPQLDVLFGDLTFSVPGFKGQGVVKDSDDPWINNIGDGNIANGTASLTYNGGFSEALGRDPLGPFQFVIEADGTLTVNRGGAGALVLAYGSGREVEVTLNGGAFITPDAIDTERNTAEIGASFFDLTAAGSTVTAAFGTDFPDLATVSGAIGDGLTFRSSTALPLSSVDNLDGTFTVSAAAIPEPASLALLGLGSLLIAGRRRRRN